MNNRKIKVLKTTIIEDNNIIKKKKFNKKTFIFSVLLLFLVISIMIIPRNSYKSFINKILAMAGIYTEEIRSVEITSNDYDDPGSFKITKSAKWISTNKVQITFDVDSVLKPGNNNKDVILVLDTSGSMGGEKFNRVISDSKDLVNLLLSDSNNRVALIEFNSTSQVLSGFTNNEETIVNLLDNITASGNTDYKLALQNIDTVMTNYNKQNDTDVVALFLTDGYPNVGTPGQAGTYTVLKDKYPYLTINGIQYEMGKDIIDEIVSISDNQFIADKTTLYNVLVEAGISPAEYEEFIIEDYINTDYFNISSVNDISVSMGDANIVEEDGEKKIVWDLGDNSYVTGNHRVMTIDLTLSDSIPSNKVFYPTNNREVITYKLDGEEQTKSSTDTPVLTNKYSVIYDPNTPTGCVINSNSSTEYQVYSTVSKSVNELSCSGHLFRGWKIDDEDDTDITHINEDLFIMPGHNITVRAEWSSQSISKSVDGTVNTHATLYKVLKEEAENNGLAKEYTGSHQDSMNPSLSTEKIYHWYATDNTEATEILDKNNVIFGGQCFQMIRTTDTGGVKMIYNGEAENNQCLSSRGTHAGYVLRTFQSLSDNYWYGTDYEYDPINKLFSLSGPTEQETWSDDTWETLVGKYTCKSTSESGTCSTLYLIESYYDPTRANVITLNSNSNYSQYGKLQFNQRADSLTYAGYKYGDIYRIDSTIGNDSEVFTIKESIFTDVYHVSAALHWYADDITYNSSTNKYSLVNPYKVDALSSALIGKYTLESTSQTATSSTAYYIINAGTTNTMTKKDLTNGDLISNWNSILFGDSITDNGNGTFTINNTVSVSLIDWYNNSPNYYHYYTCKSSSNTCSNPMFILNNNSGLKQSYNYVDVSDKIMIGKGKSGTTLTNTLLVRKDEFILNGSNYSDYKYTCNTDNAVCSEATLRLITSYKENGYAYVANRYYGSSVTWDGTNYTLVNPISFEDYNDLNLSTHHYFCLNLGEKVCSELGYVFYRSSGNLHHITLSNGVTTISKALEDMFTKNTTNSIIKNGIDAWYKHFMLEYDDYVEDIIFCNDRSLRSLAGWNDNGGLVNSADTLKFREYTVTSDLTCTNDTDKFSISNPNALLDYKVGLITSPELNILNNDNVRKTGNAVWIGSPYYYEIMNYQYVFVRSIGTGGSFGYSRTSETNGVRPAISLKPGTEYYTGDGSMEHPYIVDTDIE